MSDEHHSILLLVLSKRCSKGLRRRKGVFNSKYSDLRRLKLSSFLSICLYIALVLMWYTKAISIFHLEKQKTISIWWINVAQLVSNRCIKWNNNHVLDALESGGISSLPSSTWCQRQRGLSYTPESEYTHHTHRERRGIQRLGRRRRWCRRPWRLREAGGYRRRSRPSSSPKVRGLCACVHVGPSRLGRSAADEARRRPKGCCWPLYLGLCLRFWSIEA